MAKKYKRSSSVQTRAASAAAPAETASEPKPAAMFSRRATSSEFAPDYTYIVRDLKRIGILSGTAFVVLVVLSFILPLIQR